MWSDKVKQLASPAKSPMHKIYAHDHEINREKSLFSDTKNKSID